MLRGFLRVLPLFLSFFFVSSCLRNLFDNYSTKDLTSLRSFVPPTRDEESETQRKAHAKRVRETRRSTQGVTLDEIKSAEELVKKKNLNNNNSSANVSNFERFSFFLKELGSLLKNSFKRIILTNTIG